MPNVPVHNPDDPLETVWQLTKDLWAIVELGQQPATDEKAPAQTFGALIRFLAPVLETAYCDLCEAQQRCTCGALQHTSPEED